MSQSLIHRKDRIILSAIEVMNELGVQALSTKRVAQLEGISESTVFKHFNDKNALLVAVLDYYARYDQDIQHSIELKNLQGEEAILYYIDAYATYYGNYPAITAITQGFEEMSYIEFLEPRVRSISDGRHSCLTKLVERAQQFYGSHVAVSPEVLTLIIEGTMHSVIRKWRSDQFEFPLKEKLSEAMDSLMKVYGLKEEAGI